MERLRALSIALWPEVRSELNAFQGWLTRASSLPIKTAPASHWPSPGQGAGSLTPIAS